MEDKLESIRKIALVVGDSIHNIIRAIEMFEVQIAAQSRALSEYIALLERAEKAEKEAKKTRDKKIAKPKPHRHDVKPKKGYTTINKWNRIRSNPRLR